MPKRKFESPEEFQEYTEDVDEIIFDGFENEKERPQNPVVQENTYSGKIHTNSDVAMLMSDRGTWIYYVSNFYDGSNVDFGIFKKEFPPGLGWFKDKRVIVDLGFQGIKKLYGAKEIIIGIKRPRKTDKNPKPKLTGEEKKWNTEVSRQRIYVEHAIGKLKKFRILKNRCRIKCQDLKNRIIGVCAGLWNYALLLKH